MDTKSARSVLAARSHYLRPSHAHHGRTDNAEASRKYANITYEMLTLLD